jgi:hypothetical protein
VISAVGFFPKQNKGTALAVKDCYE